MRLEVIDRSKTLLPEGVSLGEFAGKTLVHEQVGMDADDKYLLIVRAIENTDAPPFRQAQLAAPKEVVAQLFQARLLEAVHRATLRINA